VAGSTRRIRPRRGFHLRYSYGASGKLRRDKSA
jgi:hypothetical protein